jgi:hypothetical protein
MNNKYLESLIIPIIKTETERRKLKRKQIILRFFKGKKNA